MRSLRSILYAAVLLTCGHAASAQTHAIERMTVIVSKDASATVLRKIGLPSRQYCWDACLKEERCSGVRWGVVEKDAAGMCVLLTGPLSLKELVEPKTDDGKTIHVTVARKESEMRRGT